MSPEETEVLIEELKQVIKNSKKNLESNSTSAFTLDYNIYLINYFIIRKLIEKISDNSNNLQLKREHKEIYYRIKKEMIEQIID